MSVIKLKSLLRLGKRNWESLALPFVLIITGAILMGADGFGTLSLDQIKNFWPMAIILVGLVELVQSGDAKERAGND
jgi:hypothetical protein